MYFRLPILVSRKQMRLRLFIYTPALLTGHTMAWTLFVLAPGLQLVKRFVSRKSSWEYYAAPCSARVWRASFMSRSLFNTHGSKCSLKKLLKLANKRKNRSDPMNESISPCRQGRKTYWISKEKMMGITLLSSSFTCGYKYPIQSCQLAPTKGNKTKDRYIIRFKRVMNI